MKRRNVNVLAGGLVAALIVTTVAYAGAFADTSSERQQAVSGKVVTAECSEDMTNLAALKSAGIASCFEEDDTAINFETNGAVARKTAAEHAAEAVAKKQIEAEAARKQKEAEWEGRAIASNVQQYVYVREEATADSKAVGKLPRGAAGDVIEQGEDWTHISSGVVEGYVNNDYLAFDKEALAVAEAVCDYVAKVEVDQASVHEQPNSDGAVIATAAAGQVFTVEEETNEWVKVVTPSCVGYMSKAIVDVELALSVATPIEEKSVETKAETPAKETSASTQKTEEPKSSGNTTSEASSESKEESAPVKETTTSSTSHSGKFKVTAYCSCSKCCGSHANGITATGTQVTAGRTIAVDASVIPLGTTVYIDGVPYVAEDTGVHGNTIDLYMDSHSAALNWGVKYLEVTW